MEGASGGTTLRHRPLIATRARSLRKEMSEPEVMLWSRLRGRTADKPTFRRQHAIGPIIVDFYCPSVRLAIEVDGATHWDYEARAKDATRDRWLRSQGVEVLRLSAAEIYRDLTAATDAILQAAEARGRLAPSTTRSSAGGPPPASAPHWGR